MAEERYRLAADRIREIPGEQTTEEPFRAYFCRMAEFAMMVDALRTCMLDGSYRRLPLEELKRWNDRLYRDILPPQYGESYANPAYAVKMLGKAHGQLLCALYAELRGAIVYAFEKRTEYLAILFELLIEIYNRFEEEKRPAPRAVKDIFYWYASDYSDVFAADRIRAQIDPEEDFAVELVENSDLDDPRYLYYFGEYISGNETGTAEYLASLPEETIQQIAGAYTEGYRRGFVNTGKDLSRKSVVAIRYVLGFERVVRQAIRNFREMGLRPVIYRSAVSVTTRKQHLKIGYYGAVPNKQYEYDHKDDQGLILDKRYVERRLEVMKTTYEACRELAAEFAGPACIEMFGEKPFIPEKKEEAVRLTGKQEELSLLYDSRAGQITNQYIRGDERSFTIIAFPVPEIGACYREIFAEVVKINTLDAGVYERIQQTLIDALDQGESVRILGQNGNRTDLSVRLHRLSDPGKETLFENCVADVNIPAGEVFTSPVLEGTEGVLHVRQVYLDELQYQDLEIHFSDGMTTDYTCRNFAEESENKEYIYDHILYRHPALPLGEFAIGTNTTAYVAAKKYDIADKLPILIAEKMGPHFAVGDTCYSWSEDIRVYNPDGKEIVAKENSVSARRKEDVSKAYFHCHTDITIPYEELGSITVVTGEGEEILLLKEGRFVLPGTEELNEPLLRS